MSGVPERDLETVRLSADKPGHLERAADLLRGGGLVAMPTETVYGLAANALDPAAVARIFQAKGRPGWDPLIVHVSDEAMLRRVVRDVPASARTLMDAFWPGPLTLLLPRHTSLPTAVTAGRDLVGVRMPAHPVSLELIRKAGLPLAAPSANRFGHISPTTAEHVLADLDGRMDAVLDAGPCNLGVESTVLDPVTMTLYRQGGVSAAEIERIMEASIVIYQPGTNAPSTPESLPSPGVGIRHYAPRARVLLVATEGELESQLARLPANTTALLLPADWRAPGWHGKTFRWGRWDHPDELAQTLYAGLRALDAEGITTIICPLPSGGTEPLVEAVRDRLMKAAKDR